MTAPSRKIVESALLFFAIVFSSLGFASISSSISADDGRFGASLLWFSLFAVCFLMAGALYRDRSMRVALVVLSVGPSILFTPTFAHLFFLPLSALSMLSGIKRIDQDFRSRLTLSFRRSMSMGAFLFALPLALLIASQYYAEIRSDSWQDLVPRFSLAEGGGDLVLRAAGSISPEIGKIRDERMTIDAFLSAVRTTEGDPSRGEENIFDSMSESLSLEAGRMELGELVGRDLSGDERMADVLSEALRNKMIAFLSGAKAERDLPNSVLPFFLALLLFITILSIAALLRGIWVLCAAGLIRLLIRSGALSIEKIPTEQEILA